MSHRRHRPNPDKPELDAILRREDEILHELDDLHPHLIRIKIHFDKGHHMANAGPITLTAAGQTATASIIGYDQNGNVFEGNFNPTFTSSDGLGQFATFDPVSGLVTAVSNGVAAITATVTYTDAKGNTITLTDTETVTVALTVVPPVLTTIKVAFTTPEGQDNGSEQV